MKGYKKFSRGVFFIFQAWTEKFQYPEILEAFRVFRFLKYEGFFFRFLFLNFFNIRAKKLHFLKQKEIFFRVDFCLKVR